MFTLLSKESMICKYFMPLLWQNTCEIFSVSINTLPSKLLSYFIRIIII